MASVTITLDRDVEARVSKYADGVGVPLEEVVEKALCFALKTRIDAAGRPDNSLPGGSGGRPDQSLPGRKPRCPVFDASVDNELPEGEIPVETPDQELPETAEPKA